MSANSIQIGGTHYSDAGDYQHWDFVIDLQLHYLFGCATKYVCRWRKKNGAEDLMKASHYLTKAVSSCIFVHNFETHTRLYLMHEGYQNFINGLHKEDKEIVRLILDNQIISAQAKIQELIEIELSEASPSYVDQD